MLWCLGTGARCRPPAGTGASPLFLLALGTRARWFVSSTWRKTHRIKPVERQLVTDREQRDSSAPFFFPGQEQVLRSGRGTPAGLRMLLWSLAPGPS